MRIFHVVAATMLLVASVANEGRAEGSVEKTTPDGHPYLSIPVAGVQRDFVIVAPDGYLEGDTLPLVISLHGMNTNSDEHMRYTQLAPAAVEAGYIAVFPRALEAVLLGGVRTQWDAGFGTNTNDLQFINDLRQYLIGQHNVDPKRVFLNGFSNGGMMSYAVLCANPGSYAGATIVAALMTNASAANCQANAPVLTTHGTKDEIVPLEGMSGFLSVRQSIEKIAQLQGCDSNPVATAVDDLQDDDDSTMTRFTYDGCANDLGVEYYEAEGAGHTWPGGFDIGLGATNQDINANSVFIDFMNRISN